MGQIFCDAPTQFQVNEYYVYFQLTLATLLCVFLIGAQLPVCNESCSVGEYVRSRCVEEFDQIRAKNGTSFEYFMRSFNCTNSQSYLIPGIPVDSEECLSLYDFSHGQFIL